MTFLCQFFQARERCQNNKNLVRNIIQGQTVKNLQQGADFSTEVIISQWAWFLLQRFPDQTADRLLLNDPVPSQDLLFPT